MQCPSPRRLTPLHAGRLTSAFAASSLPPISQVLQKILAASADDDVDEESIPTDEEINEMLARPNPTLGLTRDDEVNRLNALDAERSAVPRLLLEAELPEWLHTSQSMCARLHPPPN